MSLSFEVTHVFPGSEKQVAAGIHATFNMNIKFGPDILVALKDLKLNKNKKDDKFYIGQPYKEYKDSKTGETKKVYFARIWPEEKNWGKQDAIINAVKAKLKDAKPVSTTSTKNTTSADDAWA